MSVHPDAVDPRLVLNEAMIKRAAKRLKAAWPTSLKLTQAYQAFAQILGFDSLDHLQRAMPSLPAPSSVPDALDLLITHLDPELARQATVSLHLETSEQVIQTEIGNRKLIPAVDLARLGAQLDEAAGGWWPRHEALTLQRNDTTLLFIARPNGLAVAAQRLGGALRRLVKAVDPDLLNVLARHTTGTVIHLGQSGAGKSTWIKAISEDRRALGQRVGLLDPSHRFDRSMFAAEDAFPQPQGGSSSPGMDEVFDLLVIGSHAWMTNPKHMIERYRAHRPATRAITLERDHGTFLDALNEWAPDGDGAINFDEIHALVLHGFEHGQSRQSFLDRSALAVLASTPRARWSQTIDALARPSRGQSVLPDSEHPGIELRFPSKPSATEHRIAKRLGEVLEQTPRSAPLTTLPPLHFEAPTGFDHQPWSPSDHQRLDEALDRLRHRSKTKALASTSAAWSQALPHEALREALLPTQGPLGGIVVHAGGTGTGKSFWAGRVAREHVARHERVAVMSAAFRLEDTYSATVRRPTDLTALKNQVERTEIKHVVFEDGGDVEPPLTSLSAVENYLTSGLSVAMIHHADSMLALVRYWWDRCPDAFDDETSRPIRALIYHHRRTKTGFAADVILRSQMVQIGHYLRQDPAMENPLTQRAILGVTVALNLSTHA